jgi:hypothetical protein
MGHFRITESERREILGLHNNAKLIKEQASGAMDRATLINKIQSALKTKYNANLGTTGPNKDGVDGNLGPKTIAAIKAAMASKKTDTYDTAVGDVVSGQQPAQTQSGTPQQPAQTQSGTPQQPAQTQSGTPQQPAQTQSGTPQQPAQPIVADKQALVAPAAPQSIPVTNPSIQPAAQQPAQTQQYQFNQQDQDALSGKLTPQQIRQQSRFDQRLARQARRNARRAGQQDQGQEEQ